MTGAPVLVVEDDDAIADMLLMALGDAGYRAVRVAGNEAVDRARAERPSVILLDLLMPQPDGATVFRQLRAEPTTAAIPIIAMSAGRHLDTAAEALGVDDQLAKPFDLDQVYAVVARWAGPRH